MGRQRPRWELAQMKSSFAIRKPTVNDANEICLLADQLGYRSTSEQIASQIAVLLPHADQGLLVAVEPIGRVVGFGEEDWTLTSSLSN